MQNEGKLPILLITLEGGTHFPVLNPSKLCDKMSFEHFYRQSDAIKFSSCLILLSKQDTKKQVRSWASFQIFFFSVHIFPEVTLPLPSIKSPNMLCSLSLVYVTFLFAYVEMEGKLYVVLASLTPFPLACEPGASNTWFLRGPVHEV